MERWKIERKTKREKKWIFTLKVTQGERQQARESRRICEALFDVE